MPELVMHLIGSKFLTIVIAFFGPETGIVARSAWSAIFLPADRRETQRAASTGQREGIRYVRPRLEDALIHF